MRKISDKKAALELSVGTIVVIVIAMSMLILGLVLVRTIFTGSIDNVTEINSGVENEIRELFTDSDSKIVIRLPGNQVDIEKEETFGIAFGIRNTKEGTVGSETFTYEITASDIERGCALDEATANSYLILGSSGSINLRPGDEPETLLVKVRPDANAPLCEISYKLEVQDSTGVYDTEFFYVDIVGQ